MKKSDKNKRKPKPDSVFQVKEEIELMDFLLEKISFKNKNNVKSLLVNHQVEVNGKPISKHNHKLKPSSEVTIKWERSPVTKSFRGFSIVFEDEYIIVIDKHAGILSVASESERDHTAYSFLSKHVKRGGPDKKIFIVHRLDKETSGLMVFAKSQEVQHIMQDNWRDVLVERAYIAIVEGVMEDDEGEISSYLHETSAHIVYSDQNAEGGKKAVTKFKVLKRKEDYTLVEARLQTGRKNQIRVHMKEIGHPIVNDKKYGSTINPINRLGLHSKILSFVHPISKKVMRFETPMPRKFTYLF